jgi:hypothetical protein
VLPPRFAIVELGLFAAVILIERFWEPFPDLSRMNPHPYWVAVLLLSLQYGTISGLLAAMLAIVGSVMIGLVEPEIGESYFAYLVRAWTQPVLWLLTALVLGAFRTRQIEKRDGLLHEVDDLQARGVALVKHARELKDRCDSLERQLVARERPGAERLLDALAQLGAAQDFERFAAFDAALEASFPGCQASLFAVRDHGLELVHSFNWPAGVHRSPVVATGDALERAIVEERRAVSVLRVRDEGVLAGRGLAAAPVRSGARVVGMLRVEAASPAQLDAALGRRLEVLAGGLAPLCEARPPSGQTESERPAGQMAPIRRLRWPRFGLGAAAKKAGPAADDSRDRETVR